MTNLHVLYVWARACVCMLRIWMLHSTFEESGASSSAGTCQWYQWKIEKPTWTSWIELTKNRQQKETKTSSKLPKTHCFNMFFGGGFIRAKKSLPAFGLVIARLFFAALKAPTLIWAKAKGTTAITTGVFWHFTKKSDPNYSSCASPPTLVE